MREYEEVLTTIKIRRKSYEGFGDRYIKYGKQNAMEIAALGYVTTMKLSDDKRHVERIYPGYGVVAPTPIHCFETEEKVKGMEVGEALYEIVGKGISEETNPRSSWRASKKLRLQLVKGLGERTLK